MRSVISYTVGRVLIFAVSYGVLFLLGMRGFLALVVAVLVSGLASYVLLSEQRDSISAGIVGWQKRRRGVGDRLTQGAAKEDDVESSGERPGHEERD